MKSTEFTHQQLKDALSNMQANGMPVEIDLSTNKTELWDQYLYMTQQVQDGLVVEVRGYPAIRTVALTDAGLEVVFAASEVPQTYPTGLKTAMDILSAPSLTKALLPLVNATAR